MAMEDIRAAYKAGVYYIASEGVVRIVKRNPNYVTTYQESDLLDHEFKHMLIKVQLETWLSRMGTAILVPDSLQQACSLELLGDLVYRRQALEQATVSP